MICQIQKANVNQHRGGFTLVELLVSTTLVVIMMLMFATIFQLAAGSMTTQRGIAENDQRARTLTTILKADLDKRTFVEVIPFANDINDFYPTSGIDFTKRRGYFYISENDPNNDADDVLAFTVNSALGSASSDLSPFLGKAMSLSADSQDRNQPDWDDGQPENSLGDSEFAEIVYFLRNGNLYRRLLLVRQPLESALPPGEQPVNNAGMNFFDPPGNYTGNFWDEFDYSAHFSTAGAVFNGISYMPNETDPGASTAPVFEFGHPFWRFGHDHGTGYPLEFIIWGSPPTSTFIGRYTHEETSHDDFNYPHTAANVGSGIFPMSQAAANANLTVGNDDVVDQFRGGPRRAEDILMTNVHSFDVKVWDEALPTPGFVDVGHSREDGGGNPVGFFNQVNNMNTGYGPNGPTGNRVFDTWHPHLDFNNADMDDSHGTGEDPPPFRMASVGADGQPGNANVDDDMNGTPDDATELGFPGTDDVRPLRAILITIRFLDIGSDQMRQLTLIHSLID